MAKYRKVALNTINFPFHRLLQEMLEADHITLKKQGDINRLELRELQFILDNCPISVCQTAHSNTFELLALSPILDICRYHTQSNKLKVSLNICDADDASCIISSLNITKLALEYPTYHRTPALLFHRYQQAVQMGLMQSTKNELSAFAQVTPSALRAPQKRS
ncbi:hypothetical protein [Shewanella sp. MEBiC00475]|uniref:hypothetical protein n=1 Tax=Shewanella sp. MEBiC00475 TaxID=2575361 RepID=UPI0010BF72E1|nr:hypothetical protein [Shewanella sp. MEBiC00475]